MSLGCPEQGPEGGEASDFSPVLCPDCAAPLKQDLLPFQVLPGTKRCFCCGHTVSRHIRIPRSQPQTCWGCGGCSPLPGAVLGGDRGFVCLQGASRRRGAGPQSTSQSQLAESLQQGLHAAAGGEDPLATATAPGRVHCRFPHLGSFQGHPWTWRCQQ